MKKKFTLVTVILMLILLVASLTACSGEGKVVDITKFDDAKLSNTGSSIYNEIEYIGTNYRNRTFGSKEEKAFAEYLSQKLTSYGYANENMNFKFTNALNSTTNEELSSMNVVFKKDNMNTDKAVIITSQIDNMFSIEGYNDEGIYGGATGVAIMLELAKTLKDVTLPYDVYFVGFGANSLGLEGAAVFNNDFYNHHKKADTLLMVDLSKPIGGDHMYMYYDEVKTVHGEYFDKIAKDKGFDYRRVPRDKKPMQSIIIEEQPMAYTHIGVMSSNIFFIADRVPTVNFISLNWEERTLGNVVERSGKVNIANTKNDAFENFVEIVGKDRIEKEADMVYTTVLTALKDDKFADTMEKSIANMPDYSIWSNNALIVGLRLGLGVLLIVVAVLVSSKLKKDLPARSVEEFMKDMGYNGNNANTFGGNSDGNTNSDPFDSSNKTEDPFGNGGSNDNDNDDNNKSSGSDDVFGI